MIILVCAGCETMQAPPKRPVAYMFPTVRTIQSMQGLTPQHCTRDRLDWALSVSGVGMALRKSGMLEMDYDVIVRGLCQRGFAEVDARRTEHAPFRWMTFCFLPNRHLEIMACFHRLPREYVTPNMRLVKVPSRETLEACKLSNATVDSVHAETTATLRRELVAQHHGNTRIWVMRWVIGP